VTDEGHGLAALDHEVEGMERIDVAVGAAKPSA